MFGKLSEIPSQLDDALRQEQAGGQPVVPGAFVLYSLPGRDRAAESSAGELGTDAAGEARYQHDYVDVVAAAFRAHPSQRIAVILEPDSLSNLVTNLDRPRCKAAEEFYKRGIAYAISKLSLPNVFLTWRRRTPAGSASPRTSAGPPKVYKEVLMMAGGPDRIRGFALDVSNYDPAVDPAKTPRDRTSAASDETGYAADLTKALAGVGVTGKGFVIDTGRNGRATSGSLASELVQRQGGRARRAPPPAPAPNHRRLSVHQDPGASPTGRPIARRPAIRPDVRVRRRHPGRAAGGEMFDPYLIDLSSTRTRPFEGRDGRRPEHV